MSRPSAKSVESDDGGPGPANGGNAAQPATPEHMAPVKPEGKNASANNASEHRDEYGTDLASVPNVPIESRKSKARAGATAMPKNRGTGFEGTFHASLLSPLPVCILIAD
jgi:hypothetical protein